MWEWESGFMNANGPLQIISVGVGVCKTLPVMTPPPAEDRKFEHRKQQAMKYGRMHVQRIKEHDVMWWLGARLYLET